MSEPPLIKIVSKKQYLILNGKKLGLYLYSILLTAGVVGLLFYTITDLIHWQSAAQYHHRSLLAGAIASTVSALWGLLMITNGITAIKRARNRGKAIPSVQPLTARNVHLLPQQDTLVRGSDIPPTEQQSVLLRAAQKGPNTPAEQLLRAGQKGSE